MDNLVIAQRLMNMAHELEAQRSNLYRIRAYRRAAATVQSLDQPVEDIVAETGELGLRRLPGIGSHLADKIVNLVRTGEFATLIPDEALLTVGQAALPVPTRNTDRQACPSHELVGVG
jgi:DNA polymerase/3'-5' exonuclease PolX